MQGEDENGKPKQEINVDHRSRKRETHLKRAMSETDSAKRMKKESNTARAHLVPRRGGPAKPIVVVYVGCGPRRVIKDGDDSLARRNKRRRERSFQGDVDVRNARLNQRCGRNARTRREHAQREHSTAHASEHGAR